MRRWLPGVHPWVDWMGVIVRLGLGTVWALAGVAKAAHPEGAIRAVRAYRLLPDGAALVVGRGLPYLELSLALLLVVGLGVRVAAVSSAVLLVIFIGGVISVWMRGLSIDCGCFGGGGDIANATGRYRWEIARDIGFLLLAGWLAVFPRTVASLDAVMLGVGTAPSDSVPLDTGA
jgi:uncharacterized membrane protein YphA (DoxX/SURF4 family)